MTEQQPTPENLPYAAFAGGPMTARPTSVTVIAILAITFGAMNLLTQLCTGGQLLRNGSMSGMTVTSTSTNGSTTLNGNSGTVTSTSTTTTSNGQVTTTTQTNAMLSPTMVSYLHDPTVVTVSVINVLVWVILAIIAIWSGIGALRLQPAARTWLIRYAIADIVFGVLSVVTSALLVMPKMTAALQASPMATPGGAGLGSVMQIAMYLGYAFYLLVLSWPITVLYIMNRPEVKQVFGAGSATTFG